MKKKHGALKRICICALCAALLTVLMVSGVVSRADNVLRDALYQSPRALDGNVVLVGIDERALQDLGRFQDWGRDVLAQALDALNADPENRPAVIGVDVLFVGETDPDQDAWLAQAAGAYGNVVTATTAVFGSELVEVADGSFYMDRALLSYDEPYEALRAVTAQGHIDAVLDSDGILRHGLWQIDLPDGRTVPSFHQQIYRMYAQRMGLDPDVTPPMDENHFWYVPFQAEPGDYSENVSVADLISGDFAPDLFRDRIVLIGPYAKALQDAYPTAMNHASHMYGMEYQANAIDALIAGQFKTEVPMLPQAALLFVVCLVCLLWFWDRRIAPATVVWLALTGGSVVASLLAYRFGYVLHLLYLPVSVTALYIGTVALNYFRAALEKQAITNTFKRYVAPEIVTELLREGTDALSLGGKLTDIAVSFVDIRGFTSMSEQMDPEQVMEVLNRYLSLASSRILQNGGTLDKFVGDCAMAFWGAPLPQEDCVYKAVKTGLEIVADAQHLSAEMERLYGRSVSFGVGIHYGPAIVGNVGASNRMDYTAIGDTVNTAARLETNAPPGKILVSRAVADALKDRVRFTSLGSDMVLKGKASGFEVLRVEGLAEEAKEITV